MSRKALAICVVAAVIVAAAAVLRTSNRADAAAGDCYSADSGPSTPTICS
jgi:hypothetical protein